MGICSFMARPVQVYDEKTKKLVWRNEYQCQGEACENWIIIKEAGKTIGGKCGRR